MKITSTFNEALFAEAIKSKRKNLSFRDVADMAGISHTTLFRAEHQKPIDMEAVLRICDWMKTSIEIFINRKYEP